MVAVRADITVARPLLAKPRYAQVAAVLVVAVDGAVCAAAVALDKEARAQAVVRPVLVDVAVAVLDAKL